MKRKRIKYLMRSRTLWIGCCIAAHMAIILWAIFAISKVWNAFYLVIHIVNIVLLIQICANDRLTSGYRAFWLSFMILIPIFSPFFYLIWGKYSLRAKGIEVIKERNGSCMEKVPLELAEAGEFGNVIIDGPLDVKTSCEKTSGNIKGIVSPIDGEADVLIFPNIESGNAFYKAVSLFSHADMAGLLQGPSCPVVLPSRSDSGLSKYYSIAMACLTSGVKEP